MCSGGTGAAGVALTDPEDGTFHGRPAPEYPVLVLNALAWQRGAIPRIRGGSSGGAIRGRHGERCRPSDREPQGLVWAYHACKC